MTFSVKARKELCEALGIDPYRVCGDGIVFYIPVGGVPTIKVQLLVDDGQLKNFETILKKYEIVEISTTKLE
jgi:hydrogenase maturation factor